MKIQALIDVLQQWHSKDQTICLSMDGKACATVVGVFDGYGPGNEPIIILTTAEAAIVLSNPKGKPQ
jgi:hypothetical protein